MPGEVGCGDESSYMRSCVSSSRSHLSSDDWNRKLVCEVNAGQPFSHQHGAILLTALMCNQLLSACSVTSQRYARPAAGRFLLKLDLQRQHGGGFDQRSSCDDTSTMYRWLHAVLSVLSMVMS